MWYNNKCDVLCKAKKGILEEVSLEREDLKNELRSILLRSVFLNAAAYLVSALIIGFTLPIAVGLLCGTFVMLINLYLLNRSVQNAVNRNGYKANSKMFVWYVLRMSAIVVLIVAARFWSIPCMVGAVIPFLYPKLIYGSKTLFRKEE